MTEHTAGKGQCLKVPCLHSAEGRKTAQVMTRTPTLGPAAAAGRGRLPPQDAPEPAAKPACDGAEVHIKEGGKVRPMESFATRDCHG